MSMSVPNPHIRFTYDDYQTLPEDSLKRYELLDGDILVSPAPTVLHQWVAANLEFILQSHVRRHHLGVVLASPIDVVFGEGNVREVVQPDILFISNERRRIISDKEIQGAPDLLIEVLSESTAERDRGYKKTLYGRYGVCEYWLADPQARTINVYAIRGEDLVLTGTFRNGDTMRTVLLPGLVIELDAVFASD